MKKGLLIFSGIVIICTIIFIIYWIYNKNNITDIKKLGIYLDLDFNENVIIRDIKYKHSKDNYGYSTELYLDLMVDKAYANKTPYFMDNNDSDEKEYYANVESKLDSVGYENIKINYDNLLFKEYEKGLIFFKEYIPYQIDIYGVENSENDGYSKFIVRTTIPAKLNIDKERILK
ncbi:UNVERIFIED_CONTAM: hypothetical protein Cloal_2523 [Acetivibrio alkalicellulosi]